MTMDILKSIPEKKKKKTVIVNKSVPNLDQGIPVFSKILIYKVKRSNIF